MCSLKRLIFVFCSLFIFLPVLYSENLIYVIPIKGVIDLGLSSFVKRALVEAKDRNAKLVILEIDTFGGRVDAALDICKYIKDASSLKSIAFINDRAWSAGALISLACKEIYMSSTASIGSAEPRSLGFGSNEDITDEKIISAIRAQFKSLAEANNHPVNLALAMVDKDFEVKQVRINNEIKILTTEEIETLKSQGYKNIQVLRIVNPKGKLLNLTAYEAREFGLIKDIKNNIDSLLESLDIENREVNYVKINFLENFVRFITHPLVSSLLFGFGVLAIFFELKTPGWSGMGFLGIILLSLFFWGHCLVGLANWIDFILFGIGIILILLEIFVFPGFGISGILGIICLILSLFLALIKLPLVLPSVQIKYALNVIVLSIFFIFLGLLIIVKFFPKIPIVHKIVLNSKEDKKEGYVAVSLDNYIGKIGITITTLSPVGKADFSGTIKDVISRGEFIDKNKQVKVIRIHSNTLVVEEV